MLAFLVVRIKEARQIIGARGLSLLAKRGEQG
jgi:hypothetical protein